MLNSKIINDKGEQDGVSGMFPEAWYLDDGGITKGREAFDQVAD